MKFKKDTLSSIFFVFIFAVLVTGILILVYSEIDKEFQAGPSTSYLESISNVDTPIKKWLNGYLGPFFQFKYFGNINWLAIPLLIYFLLTVKNRKRWQKALAFIYTAYVILMGINVIVGARGYYWWRYQMTLYPFTIGLVIVLGWEIIKDKNMVIKSGVCIILGGAVLFNVIHYFDSYYKYQWVNEISMINKKYPTEVFDYIDDLKQNNQKSKFLTCSQRITLYYYGNDKSIYYYWRNAKFRKLSRKNLFSYLKEDLRIDYIFTRWIFERYEGHLPIKELIDLDCEILANDNGYRLYKLRNKPLEEALQSKAYFEYKVWSTDQGEFEKKVDSGGDITRFLRVQGIRGEFSIERQNADGESILSLRNLTGGEDGKRVLQLGYSLDQEFIQKHSLNSKHVYFLVDIMTPRHLIKRDNFIFIQDYEEKWERAQTYFARADWRTYLVHKKIRPGPEWVGLGFKFEPESEKDELQIKDIQIYFLDGPI